MITSPKIEAAARRAYYAHYKMLPTGNFPPAWENTSEEVREWVRQQIRCAFGDDDEQPGSLNPPVRLGQQEC